MGSLMGRRSVWEKIILLLRNPGFTPGATNITSHPGLEKRNGKLNAKCEAHQQGEPYKLFHHNHFFD